MFWTPQKKPIPARQTKMTIKTVACSIIGPGETTTPERRWARPACCRVVKAAAITVPTLSDDDGDVCRAKAFSLSFFICPAEESEIFALVARGSAYHQQPD
jgi:hypothetical protein